MLCSSLESFIVASQVFLLKRDNKRISLFFYIISLKSCSLQVATAAQDDQTNVAGLNKIKMIVFGFLFSLFNLPNVNLIK